MASKNPILQTMIEMTGQRNQITVSRALVEFLGGYLEGALMLGQLLFWTPRSRMKGWIAKSDADMRSEIFLTRHGIRSARKMLEDEGLIETKKAMFNGSPTTHYHVVLDELERQWVAWLDKKEALSGIRQSEKENDDHCLNPDNPLSESRQSLTKTTTKINTTATTGDTPNENSGAEKDATQNIFTVYEQNIGVLTPMLAERLKVIEKGYPANWFTAAVMESVENNARNLKYIEAILQRWQRDGFKTDKRQRKGKRYAKTKTSGARVQNAGADPDVERENIAKVRQRLQRKRNKL